jgi:hypothetical protein
MDDPQVQQLIASELKQVKKYETLLQTNKEEGLQSFESLQFGKHR